MMSIKTDNCFYPNLKRAFRPKGRRILMSIYDDKPWLNHYDDGVDPEVTVSSETGYADLSNPSVKSNPAAPAIHFMGVTFSYGELD